MTNHFQLIPTSNDRRRRRPGGLSLVALGVLMVIGGWPSQSEAQTALTWQQVRDRYEATNPTLRADQTGIEESKAAEISAYARPNPVATVVFDQIGHNDDGKPFEDGLPLTALSFLHERGHKRELRRDSAQSATAIAVTGHVDLDRNLIFNLRAAFVQTLQAKAVQALTRENLAFFDRALAISDDRYLEGDLAQVDLDRLHLQRVQYESDLQTATVNLRVAKIQLLRLLNDQSAADQFDVTGPYEFAEPKVTLETVRQIALDVRPDLHAAMQAIEKAKIDHRLAIANGSVDPVITVDAGFPALTSQYLSYPSPLHQYGGVSISLPLKIFDRNQGEKLRTQLDITRNEQLTDAVRAQVFSDVDTAYATLASTVELLSPYKAKYLDQATRVRDVMNYSYQRGNASLLDFMQAQQDYRSIQLTYINLIGAYLAAAAQVNFAVGQEVIS
jgi:outer membrane protein, heavy metal efflux system